jgi:hypothetical protein
MEFRLAELENPARQHGIRLGQVATRQNAINELKRASFVMRAESYRRRPTRTLEGAPTVSTRSRAMSAMQELGLRRERVSTA